MSAERDFYVEEIHRLRKEKRAVILAHNYQRPEVQDIADYTGDSLGLAQKAVETDARTIVFCGVHFMAETAHILNPDKTVLLPEIRAGCPLADMVTADDVVALKKTHPGAPVVCYVNSSAAVKAVSDVSCTSANAVAIVQALGSDQIIFVPDRNLGRYVEERTGKKLISWPGFCPTHKNITAAHINELKLAHPGAVFVAHPECDHTVLELADHICSTSGMYEYAKNTSASVIIVGSEIGMLHRLQNENPDKTFLLPTKEAVCPNMKLTTLKKIYLSLLNNQTPVVLPHAVRAGAYEATKRMMAIFA